MADKIITEFELDISGYEASINKAIEGMEGLQGATTDTQKDLDGVSGRTGEASKRVAELAIVTGRSAAAMGDYAKQADAARKKSKDLSNTIAEQQRITLEFQKELDQVNKRLAEVPKGGASFFALQKRAEALKEAIKDNNFALKELRLDKAEVDKSIKGFDDLAKAAGDKPGGFGAALSDVKGQLASAFPQLAKLAGAARTLGVAMTTALGPVGLVILAIVGAFTALGKIFFGTQEGADKLDKVLQPLKAVFSALLGVAQQLTSALFNAFDSPQDAVKALWETIKAQIVNRINGVIDQFRALSKIIQAALDLDFEGVKEGALEFGESVVQTLTGVDDLAGKVKQGFSDLGDTISDAAAKGARIAEIRKELALLAIETAENEGRLNREFQEQVQLAQDVNLTAKEREEAGNKAIEAQEQITALRQRELDLQIEQLNIQYELNDTLDEEKLELAKLVAAKEQAEADRIAATRRITNTLNGIRKQETDKAIAEAKRRAQEQQKIEEQRVAAAQKTAEIIAGIEERDELRRLDATSRRVREVEIGYEREIAAAREAFKALREISPEGDRAEIAAREARTIAAIEESLQDELTALRDEEAAKDRKRIEDATEELRQAVTSRADLEREAVEQRFDRLREIAAQTIEDEEALNTTLVELEMQRAEAIAEIQDEAFAAEREKQAQRMALYEQTGDQVSELLGAMGAGAVSSAEDVSKALLAIALDAAEKQALIFAAEALGKEVATKGLVGIATGALLAGLIKAAFAGLRAKVMTSSSTPAFHDGGLVGRDGGTRMHGGRDGWLTRVERGEYVMPTVKTKRYMPYLEAMRDGRFEHMMAIHQQYRQTRTDVPSFNDRGIVGALGGVGSLSEQRKQTALLAMVAHGLRRGKNVRYTA